MIINFNERAMQVKPKQEARQHRGQHYVLEYDPRAPSGECWVWHATVTRKYEFIGNGATIEAAARNARRRIDFALRVAGDG